MPKLAVGMWLILSFATADKGDIRRPKTGTRNLPFVHQAVAADHRL